MMQLIFLFLICVFSTGCQKSYINVVQEKVHRKFLASSFVGSPDPLQYHPPHGQKLYISWNIVQQYSLEDYRLRISILFRNLNTKEIEYTLPRKRGTIVYSLLGQDYFETHGLLAYKVEVITQEEVVAFWTHQMWVNIVQLPHSPIDMKAQVIGHFTEY